MKCPKCRSELNYDYSGYYCVTDGCHYIEKEDITPIKKYYLYTLHGVAVMTMFNNGSSEIHFMYPDKEDSVQFFTDMETVGIYLNCDWIPMETTL